MKINNCTVSPNFKSVYFCPKTIKALERIPETRFQKFDEFTILAQKSPAAGTHNVHLVWLPDLTWGLIAPTLLLKHLHTKQEKQNVFPKIINYGDELQICDNATDKPDYTIEKKEFLHNISANLNPKDLTYLHLNKVSETTNEITPVLLSFLAKSLDDLIDYNIEIEKKKNENPVGFLISNIFNDAKNELETKQIKDCTPEQIEEFANIKYNELDGRKRLFLNLIKTDTLNGSDFKLSDIAHLTEKIADAFNSESEEDNILLNSNILYKPVEDVSIKEFVDTLIHCQKIFNLDDGIALYLRGLMSMMPDDIKVIDILNMLNDLPIDIELPMAFDIKNIDTKKNILDLILNYYIKSDFEN